MAVDIATTLLLYFEEEKPIAALDLSSLIFDLNRIYVLALKNPDGDYGSVREFRNFGRNSYRLSQDLRLNVARIRFESPGLIELASASVAGASAIWITVQTLEKLASWPLNRQKLRLEVMKLERDLGRTSPITRGLRVEPFLNIPEVGSSIRQLEINPLKASAIEISPGSAISQS